MGHIFERATSGRSKCRGCSQPITKGELRFGERVPNAFGDGEATLWYHPPCAAYRRPETVAEALAEHDDVDDTGALAAACAIALAGRRVRRIGVTELAPSGRARCRHCRELIAKDDWRTPLIFFEDGVFSASGYVHVACLSDYCEGAKFLPVLDHFTIGVSDDERRAIMEVASQG